MLLTPAQILDATVLGASVASVCLFAIQPGQIFGAYWDWLDNLAQTRPYLAKPLGYCEVCTAGQMSFWFFFLGESRFSLNWHSSPWLLEIHLDWFTPCLMAPLAMVAAKLVSRLTT